MARLATALDTEIPRVHGALRSRNAATPGARQDAAGSLAFVRDQLQGLKSVWDGVVTACRREENAVEGASDVWYDAASTSMWSKGLLFVLEGATLGEDTDVVHDLYDRLDLALGLQQLGLVDATLTLAAFQDALEQLPVPVCTDLFSYAESRAAPLTEDMSPSKGKGLVLLRLCNELLRRFARGYTPHAVFAGRILALLASAFPISERSGVNLKGDFHVENVTRWEEDGRREEDSAFEERVEARTEEVAEATTGPVESMDVEADGDGKENGSSGPQPGAPESATQLDAQGPRDRRSPPASLTTSPHFYSMLWGLQQYFSQPTLLFQQGLADVPCAHAARALHLLAEDEAASPMRVFQTSTACVLDVFAQQEGPATERPQKRARHHTSAADSERTPQEEAHGACAAQDQTRSFYPKHLTGRRLLAFQLPDVSFRRHVLTQLLLTLQYMLGLTGAGKERRGMWKNKLLVPVHILDEDDERWTRAVWRQVLAQLRVSGADGKQFLDTVLSVLKRESSWLHWKTDSAPPLEKAPMEAAELDSWLAQMHTVFALKITPYPHALGTPALTELWEDGFYGHAHASATPEHTSDDAPAAAGAARVPDGLEALEIPPPLPSLGALSRELHMEKQRLKQRVAAQAADDAIAETTSRAQGLAWRALRRAGRSRLHLFAAMADADDVPGLLRAMDDEEKRAAHEAAETDGVAHEASWINDVALESVPEVDAGAEGTGDGGVEERASADAEGAGAADAREEKVAKKKKRAEEKVAREEKKERKRTAKEKKERARHEEQDAAEEKRLEKAEDAAESEGKKGRPNDDDGNADGAETRTAPASETHDEQRAEASASPHPTAHRSVSLDAPTSDAMADGDADMTFMTAPADSDDADDARETADESMRESRDDTANALH
ncbi:hypothetical protein MSPP1_000083 [Malassezia sp. CBS 17886]|nr:hypothetical protein MSPP1_000083 [Malassezia sp. CBS 17886]